MNEKELLKMAKEAKENAYVPYSKFRVGAALLGKSGKVYTGCNIENAAFGVTNCAERTALFKAVSEGERAFDTIAVTSDSHEITHPCGTCRQALVEFSPDMTIVSSNKDLESEALPLSALLAKAFTGKEME